jgi:hypothetical protein
MKEAEERKLLLEKEFRLKLEREKAEMEKML